MNVKNLTTEKSKAEMISLICVIVALTVVAGALFFPMHFILKECVLFIKELFYSILGINGH